MTEKIMAWWRGLPWWARWTVGAVVVTCAAFWLIVRRPGVAQIRAATDAEGAATAAAVAIGDGAAASADAADAADAMRDAVAEAPDRDAADDAMAAAAARDAGRRAGDGTTDLGDGLRGGRVDDL